MQQLTTVYQKYVTENDQSVKPPTFKNVGDSSPNPLRIDAPVRKVSELSRSIGQIIVLTGVSLYLTPSFGINPLNPGLRSLVSKTRHINLS